MLGADVGGVAGDGARLRGHGARAAAGGGSGCARSSAWPWPPAWSLFVFALVDVARPDEVQTHLARLAEHVLDGRWEHVLEEPRAGAGRPAWAGPSWPAGSRSGVVMVAALAVRRCWPPRAGSGPRATRALRRTARRWPRWPGWPCWRTVGLVANDSSVAVPLTMLIVVAPGRHPPGGGARGRCGRAMTRAIAVRLRRLAGCRACRARGDPPGPTAARRARRGAGRSRSSSSWPGRPGPREPRTPTIPAGPTPASTGSSSSPSRASRGPRSATTTCPRSRACSRTRRWPTWRPAGVIARSTPGAAYLTISAGTRAAPTRWSTASSSPSASRPAARLRERSSSAAPESEPDGRYVALSWPTLQRVNARRALRRRAGPADRHAGRRRSRRRGDRQRRRHRLGGHLLRAPGGPGGRDQRRRHPRGRARHRPAGPRSQPALRRSASTSTRSIQRFQHRLGDAGRPCRRPRHRRGVRPGPLDALPRPRRRAALRGAASQALADTDELVARLLEQVDPERDAVMLLAPYNLPGDRDLTVSALRAPGTDPGYMRSASTQRSGLPHAGRRRPDPARPARRRPARSRWRVAPPRCVASDDTLDERVDRLVALNEASRFREQLLFPTTLAVVVVLGLICAAAIVVLARGDAPAGPAGRGVRRAGRPGGAADVVPRPRLSAGGPGRRLLLGLHRGRRARGGHRG